MPGRHPERVLSNNKVRVTLLSNLVAFLGKIGIEAAPGAVRPGSFLPGIRVVGGTLIYDDATLAWPGDLLHEAGHIAVVPSALRSRLSDGLELDAFIENASEIEATAWAFAAVCHLGLDPAVLFHEGGYAGASPGLLATFSLGVYPGAAGLARAGMTHVGEQARRAGLPTYPAMARWLRA